MNTNNNYSIRDLVDTSFTVAYMNTFNNSVDMTSAVNYMTAIANTGDQNTDIEQRGPLPWNSLTTRIAVTMICNQHARNTYFNSSAGGHVMNKNPAKGVQVNKKYMGSYTELLQ